MLLLITGSSSAWRRGAGSCEALAGHHHLAGCPTHRPAGFMATDDL